MTGKKKDVDYLSVSASIWAIEPKMLNGEKQERILSSGNENDIIKILEDCGYTGMEEFTVSALEESIKIRKNELFGQISQMAPDHRLVDAFMVKYDYHNLKVLLKAADNEESDDLLSHSGRYEPDVIKELVMRESASGITDTLLNAYREAKDILVKTCDPQKADIVLDKAAFAEALDLATEAGSVFLKDYLRLSIDAANLKTAVRLRRMGIEPSAWSSYLIADGNTDVQHIQASGASKGALPRLYEGTDLYEAAVTGDELTENDKLTSFERMVDNAQTAFLKNAQLSGFGEEVLVGFVYAVEQELSAVRIIISGKIRRQPEDFIRERLRDSYV